MAYPRWSSISNRIALPHYCIFFLIFFCLSALISLNLALMRNKREENFTRGLSIEIYAKRFWVVRIIIVSKFFVTLIPPACCLLDIVDKFVFKICGTLLYILWINYQCRVVREWSAPHCFFSGSLSKSSFKKEEIR